MPLSRMARRALVVIAAAALGAGLAAPAQAGVERQSDPAKDVTRFSEAHPGGKRVKSNRTADVTRFTTRHGRKVVLTTTMRALDRTPGQTFFFAVVQTPTNDYVVYGALAGKGGEVDVVDDDDPLRLRLRAPFSVAGQPPPSCPGARLKVTRRNTFRTTIPRSCLGAPRWVRTGAGVSVATERGYLADDAGRRGIDDPSRPPRLGEKVRRG